VEVKIRVQRPASTLQGRDHAGLPAVRTFTGCVD
jgi:hypothetical protein